MTTRAIESIEELAHTPWPARARLTGWVLLACWLLVIPAGVLLGERSSSLAALRSAVANGDVEVIRVSGGMPLEEGARGYAALEIHWRNGLFAHHAEVREAEPLGAAPKNGNIDVVRAGVVDRLVASQPGLRVVREPDHSTTSFGGNVLGWQLPEWLAGAGLLLMLATLGLLISGPQPWRATRWAWFWILGIAPPLGVLVYLVFAGPTALSRPPRAGSARLTGGWAFLLALVVSSLLSATAGTIQ